MTTEHQAERSIELRLAAVGFDTHSIRVVVCDSTAILSGTITKTDTRQSIVEALFGVAAVDSVVDSLSLSGQDVSPQIYLRNNGSLRPEFETLLHPALTRELEQAAGHDCQLP